MTRSLDGTGDPGLHRTNRRFWAHSGARRPRHSAPFCLQERAASDIRVRPDRAHRSWWSETPAGTRRARGVSPAASRSVGGPLTTYSSAGENAVGPRNVRIVAADARFETYSRELRRRMYAFPPSTRLVGRRMMDERLSVRASDGRDGQTSRSGSCRHETTVPYQGNPT
jgi:hypothetical protein